ncbi:MAG: hypothetical protein CBC22_04890 [Alphaproteobacteria bacterium TMED62]|nr:MAG: hypothetical protein CBC22_04890 [Alphaproteobacteria bacterium TMED62]
MTLERNVIVEEGFDFWKELNEDEDKDEDDNKNIDKNLCELTREPLIINYITLPCGHRFNYKPLCIELCTLKDPKNVKSMTRYLGSRRICCPYCRQVFNKLLPIIPTIDVGILLPKYVVSTTNCVEHKVCKYVYKSGSKKGSVCGCNGFDYNGTSLCIKHWKAEIKRKTKITSKKLSINDLSNDAKKIYRKMKVREMKEILKEQKQKVSGSKVELANRLSNFKI